MLLVRRAPLDVSRFFHESMGREPFEQERGLVVRVRVRFAEWLPGELAADAFVDPGADGTMLSHRWALSCRREVAVKRALIVEPHPLLDAEANILETVSVAIGQSGWLDLPSELQLARQGGPHPEQLRDMPGYEDILLGRDFLR